MLTYMHNLTLMLEPTELVNSSDVRLAVSRVVTWTTEPKSVEVRKVFNAQEYGSRNIYQKLGNHSEYNLQFEWSVVF